MKDKNDMRLIDANELRERLEDVEKQWTGLRQDGIVLAISLLDDAPDIAPEDLRPHGRWNEDDEEWFFSFECSVCAHKVRKKSRYCPFCGAKMDKEEKQ